LSLVVLCLAGDPSYDHQTTTYRSRFHGETVTSASMTVTTYFSPDHSIGQETKLIESAQKSVDIFTPGWDSWSGCTNFTGVQGCSVYYCRNSESFAIFRAVLNALHRGVTVRILTNNYNSEVGQGLIDPLDFLTLAGAKTNYYTTTTFMHAKYISVDASAAAVASVNFDYTSFMENREAGMVLSGSGASPLIAFMTSVYNYDFNNGKTWVTNSYNSSDMAIINNPALVNVVIPPPRNYSGAYVTSVNTITGTFDSVSVYTSPDYAFAAASGALNETSSSLHVEIYQITGGFCDIVLQLHTSGIDLKILVSNHIYSKIDYEAAKKCYTQLYNAGYTVRLTADHMFTYSHQKFWIIDSKQVWLSTGNWGSTDYPSDPQVFPPYGSEGWRDINRDFTVQLYNDDVVNVYENVLDQDYKRGYDFSPYDNRLYYGGFREPDMDY